MLDVVTFGEAMVLLAAEETGPLAHVRRFSKHTAGAETNVAVGLARLGLRVGWISRLGNDTMGQFLRDAFVQEGIDCSQVHMVSGARTGFMFKGRVDDGSDPPIEYHRQGSAASLFGADDVPLAWIKQSRHLHATGVFAALTPNTLAATQTAMTFMRAQGKTISFDPNLRPALWSSESHMRNTLNALAAQADWVLPGLDEGRLLTGCNTPEDIAQFYRTKGAKGVVVKLGAEGAYMHFDNASGYVPAHPVDKVIDTVGAGDAFAVGIISGLLEKLSPQQAVQRATWMGARAVQVRGDSDGLPTRAELNAAQMQPAQHTTQHIRRHT